MTAATPIAVLVSHPIQYFGPFFRRLSARPELDLTVLYSSTMATSHRPQRDHAFDRTVVWDTDLLTGYHWKVLRNPINAHPQRRLSMLSPGVSREVASGRYAALVVMGWAYPADWIAVVAARVAGVPYLVHSDTDVRDPGYSPTPLRKAVLRWLCRNAAGGLYTGTFNRDFYIRNGTPPERLWFSPWSVEIDLFRQGDRLGAREELGLRDDVCYLLFVGALIPRKRPDFLLSALGRLQREGHRVGLLFAGTGALEGDLRAAAERERLSDVHFLGFVNQSRLPTVYAAGDVLVLPSVRDPRATVVNEAMAAGLPVVISSGTGVWGPGDLVKHGREGIVFEVNDRGALLAACRQVLDPAVRRTMGEAAARRVERWSYEVAVEGWVEAVTSVAAADGAPSARKGPR